MPHGGFGGNAKCTHHALRARSAQPLSRLQMLVFDVAGVNTDDFCHLQGAGGGGGGGGGMVPRAESPTEQHPCVRI